MSLIYPRLPHHVAKAMAESFAGLSTDQLKSENQDVNHPQLLYAPTGGAKARDAQLLELQSSVRACAEKYGYPENQKSDAYLGFDVDAGQILHSEMRITASEGSDIGIWYFMTCVLLPDVVRWRFPGDGETSLERFLGSGRGMRRNTFGRLWWRAFLLYDEPRDNPYWLIEELNEDDLVQITERPSIAGGERLPRLIAEVFSASANQYPEIPRRLLLRESIKRVRRLIPIIGFDIIDADLTRTWVHTVFNKTIATAGGEVIQSDPVREQSPTYHSSIESAEVNGDPPIVTADVESADLKEMKTEELAIIADKNSAKVNSDSPIVTADVESADLREMKTEERANIAYVESAEVNGDSPIVTAEVEWEDLIKMKTGERAIISDKEAKKSINRLLSSNGFTMNYNDEEQCSDWVNGSFSFRVLHKANWDSKHKAGIMRTG